MLRGFLKFILSLQVIVLEVSSFPVHFHGELYITCTSWSISELVICPKLTCQHLSPAFLPGTWTTYQRKSRCWEFNTCSVSICFIWVCAWERLLLVASLQQMGLESLESGEAEGDAQAPWAACLALVPHDGVCVIWSLQIIMEPNSRLCCLK